MQDVKMTNAQNHGARKCKTWKPRTNSSLARYENDGPSKSQGVNMQDMKMQDMKTQDTSIDGMKQF